MSDTAGDTGNFSQFSLGRSVQRGVAAAGFDEPRPIQQQTIPAVLDGRDVMGLAQTGTGKTAAFALPILERLMRHRGPGPRALIVAPTRELATQIEAELRTLGRFTRIKTALIFGGVGEAPQLRALRARPDVIVACPGRLLDLHRRGLVCFDRIETLVLDEADHMFDMGFLPDIRRIIAALPAARQNLLFSATMPDEIRSLAQGLLDRPHVVELQVRVPLETIQHALYPVQRERKRDLVQHLLSHDRLSSAIVFTRTKHRAKRLAQQLSRSGHRAVALQGNMSQPQRERAMRGFRDGTFDVLVATDIAARGIDVAGVSHVINFDVPDTADAYTHRIGRTGRAERSGKAYTFVTLEDSEMVHSIERKLGVTLPRCHVDGFERVRIPSEKPAQPRSPARQGRGRRKKSRRR